MTLALVLVYPALRLRAGGAGEWMLRLTDLVVLSAPLVVAVVVAARAAASRREWSARLRRWTVADVVLGVGVAVVLRTLVELVQPTSGSLEGPLAEPGPARLASTIVLVVGIAAVTPIVEELFFRGLVQQALAESLGELGRVTASAAAIVVSTAAFVVLHVLPGGGTVPIALLVGTAGVGVACGILYSVTGRLGGSVVAHIVFNASGVLLLVI